MKTGSGLNKLPLSAVLVVLVIGVLGYLVWRSVASTGGPGTGNMAFFSVDDGATWFAEDASRVPPFDHGGKTAVRCHVFSSDGGKTKVVLYLSRYTPDAKALLERLHNDKTRADAAAQQTLVRGEEIKRPGGGEWMNRMSPRAREIMASVGPDAMPVEP